MRKFFRLLFSRFTLMFLAVLIQVAFAVAVTFYFSTYYRVLSIVSTVLLILVLLLIVNRDMGCDAKLPWSIIVSIVPIAGAILYICFSRNRASRSEIKRFAKLPQTTMPEEKVVAPKKYLNQIEYLKGLGAYPFSNTDTEYFPSGELFLTDFLQELEKAEKYIFLEYFIVEHGKMLDAILEVLKRKIAMGVEVRLMYDDFGSLTHTKHNFCKEMKRLGINCVRFARMKPIISVVYNNRDHRKIAVIDGKVGYMSGFNLADEYINETHPYGYWKDTGVKVCGNVASAMVIMFLRMFDMTTKTNENFEDYVNFSEQASSFVNKGIVVPFGDGPRPIYNEEIAKNVYLNLINQAEESLYITTPYLITDETVMTALMLAAQRGVNVNVIIPKIPDKKTVFAMTKQSCGKLVKAGVHVYMFTPGFIHAKSIVADGVAGVVGTINLDYRSLMHHYECGMYMYNTLAVKQLYQDLTTMLARCELQENPPKLHLWEKLTCALINLFRPLI